MNLTFPFLYSQYKMHYYSLNFQIQFNIKNATFFPSFLVRKMHLFLRIFAQKVQLFPIIHDTGCRTFSYNSWCRIRLLLSCLWCENVAGWEILGNFCSDRFIRRLIAKHYLQATVKTYIAKLASLGIIQVKL